MRQTLIKALLTLTFMICGLESFAQSTPTENRWDNLIKAISAVESKGNPRAVSGKHVGILQISPIAVDECNRINKLKKNKKRFTYKDRYSVEKSIEMFWIIQKFYKPKKEISDLELQEHMSDLELQEHMIRLWNGGCGYSKKATNGYLKKVLKELEKIETASE